MQALLSGVRPWVILWGVCGLLYLPGIVFFPITDSDEAHVMQSTRQMMQTGDFALVRFQDTLHPTTPPGLYWLQAASVHLFSHFADTTAWPYRVPSFLGILLTVFMVFRLGCSFFDRRVAFVAGLIAATMLVVVGNGHLATTDAILMGLTTTAFSTMGMVYMQSRGGRPAPSWAAFVFWLSMGGAILVKGLSGPFFVIITALSLMCVDRRIDWLHGLRPVMGVLLCIALVAPWIASASDMTEGAFAETVLREDVLSVLLGYEVGYVAWPGVYILLASIALWPASFLLWPAVRRSWQERALPGLRFLLVWLVPSWIVLELIPTKLPHYPLPLYPACALMIATTVMAVRDDTRLLLWRWESLLWYGIWSLLGVALAAGLVWLPLALGQGWGLGAILAGVGVGVTLIGVWRFLLRGLFLPALVTALAVSLPLYLVTFNFLLPSLSSLWISQSLAQELDRYAPGGRVAAVGYHEPSLVFLAGTDTLLLGPRAAAEALEADQVDVAVVEERSLDAFQQSLPSKTSLDEKTVIDGVRFPQGQPVKLHILVKGRGQR